MKVTFDSNILVYAADHQAGDRNQLAMDILHRAAHADCVLILQSLGEFFHAATRKMKLAARDVEVFVEDWRTVFPVHAASEHCLAPAIELVKRHSFSFWDAMLWVTAHEAGCRLLLSEDLHDGRTLDGVTCVNPFEPKNAMVIEAALPSVS
jgi:predicted nucleic acid-binding protein